MTPRLVLSAIAAAALCCSLAIAQGTTSAEEANALALAKREAREAAARAEKLERERDAATGEAAKARAAASAVAAKIQEAEADLTAAETRVRIVEGLRAQQRARLALRQGPVVRLTAALQTMARRPPALAMIQPGSIDDVVHVRSLLASTLPVIRARTAGLREEIRAGDALRRQAETARSALIEGQQELKKQRLALSRLEQRQRARSQELASSALVESDRALSLSEEARDLTELMGTREYQARVRQRLAGLPGPMLRPGTKPQPPRSTPPPYRLPVEGRLLTGTGEISEAGVHARGLTFETTPGAEVVAPRSGRIVYAGRFRGYGEIVIIEHGGGWTSVITDLAAVDVAVGSTVRTGEAIGRASQRSPRVSVELRRNGTAVAIAPLIGLG